MYYLGAVRFSVLGAVRLSVLGAVPFNVLGAVRLIDTSMNRDTFPAIRIIFNNRFRQRYIRSTCDCCKVIPKKIHDYTCM